MKHDDLKKRSKNTAGALPFGHEASQAVQFHWQSWPASQRDLNRSIVLSENPRPTIFSVDFLPSAQAFTKQPFMTAPSITIDINDLFMVTRKQRFS